MFKQAVDRNKHLRDFAFWNSVLSALGVLKDAEGFRKFIIYKGLEDIDYELMEQWLHEDGFLFSYVFKPKENNASKKEVIGEAAAAA